MVEQNKEEAVKDIGQFLRILFPEPIDGLIEIRAFTHEGKAKAVQKYIPDIPSFGKSLPELLRLNQTHGIYFGVCPRAEKKGSKDAVRQVHCLWADIDAKDFKGHKAEALEKIRAFPILPTILVDSGNGYHAYWRLRNSVQVADVAARHDVEAVLRGIALTLGADKQAAEVARVLRLPFTKNIKDPANPKPVDIVEIVPERIYQIEDFAPYRATDDPQPLKDGAAKVTFSKETVPITLETLRVSPRIKKLIQKGLQKDSNYPSRSEADEAVIVALCQTGHTPDEIRAVFVNSEWQIGGKYREKRDGDSYLAYSITKAHRFIDENERQKVRGYILLGNAIYAVSGFYGEKKTKLTNFAVQVVEEVMRDDGVYRDREYKIKGILETGEPLGLVCVPVDQFGNMAWIQRAWGIRAILAAGPAVKDKLREAIQQLSGEVPLRHIYTHTGWIEVNGSWAYLFHGGAIGIEGLTVELDRDLARYRLGLPKDQAEKETSLRLSLSFLETIDSVLSVPLWSAIWLAPLVSFLNPDFVLWVSGSTGTFKSTVCGLALAHFGDFERLNPPASWTGTTNALEKKAFTVKDALLLIDDFAPGSHKAEANELESKAHRLIRNIGNKAARERLRSDLTVQRTYYPRCLVIGTGEQIPTGGGESTVARMFAIETSKDGVRTEALNPLQQNARLLPLVMGCYLTYLIPKLGSIAKDLRSRWEELRDSAQKGTHRRIPESTAYLQLGNRLGLDFMRDQGILDAEGHKKLLDFCDKTIVELAKRHAERVTDERPAIRYLNALHEMLMAGHVVLLKADGEILATEHREKEIGWYDDRFIYLLPKITLGKVRQFFDRSGEFFGLAAKALHKQLYELGFLEKNPTYPRYEVKAARHEGGDFRWVIRLRRSKVEGVVSLISKEKRVGF